MTSEFVALCLTAVFVGAVHTAAGPDHSIPFVAMSRAGGWSAVKTFWVTVACGLGHVAGSAVLGLVGLSVGGMVLGVESWDSLRGDIAAWMLIAFGLAYLAWGLHRATRSDAATHAHSHVVSQHEHADAWTHGHASAAGVWTPGMLFLIFVFGPSEPLVPLLMVPAARCGPGAMAAVVAMFALATVVTMTLSVMLIRYGVSFVPQLRLGRFDHAVAGLALLACGALVKFGL